MCLITEMKKPLIAKKDIKAYKVITKARHSVMFNYEYKKDKLYKTRMETDNSWATFDTIDREYYELKYGDFSTNRPKELKSIGPGFHAGLLKKRVKHFKNSDDMIVHVTYPKGCKYYLDATGLIVGNQIIVH